MPIIVCPIQLFNNKQKIYLQYSNETNLIFLEKVTLEKLPEKLTYWADRMKLETIHLYTNDTFAQEIVNRIKAYNNLIKVEVN